MQLGLHYYHTHCSIFIQNVRAPAVREFKNLGPESNSANFPEGDLVHGPVILKFALLCPLD